MDADEEQAHRAVIVELAQAVVDLGRPGLTWEQACELGHDGIVDNTELTNARRAVSSEACGAIYTAEVARLAGAPARGER